MMDKLWSALREQLLHLRGRWPVLLLDAAMVPVAWVFAYWLRYNLAEIPPVFLDRALSLIPLVTFIQALAFVLVGVHRGVWRFTSVPDLVRLIKAVCLGTAVAAVAIFLFTRLEQVPRSVFVLYAVLLLLFVAAPRLLYRLRTDRHLGRESELKVLIVGAGSAGEMLVRDLLRARPRLYSPVGFVDDDPTNHGKEIHGVRVLGGCAELPALCAKWSVERLMIAMPSATARQMRRVVEHCESARVPFRTLPKLNDIIDGRASSSQLREVAIDDLLGREQVSLDWERITAGLQGKRILVTGGGGSIGSELCHQLARLRPEQLILYEQSEFNLYSTTLELRREHPTLELVPVLGDVCDESAVDNALSSYRPQVVFHAAAYKHVPLLQVQARETVKNNVLGTALVAEAADRLQAEAFVLISTDKAVNPTSMMGASKRIAEMYCQAIAGTSQTRFITVRFGNVLGSAGSVVPLFNRQIASGGPVTVTHPEVTRYFMTIAEASQLILQASVIGGRGEIFVLNMGEPIKIAYLARQMIQLAGKVPDEDVRIVYTGLRPGEKMAEELFHSDESLTDTGFDKLLLARSRRVSRDEVMTLCAELEEACGAFDYARLEDVVRRLVPEYGTERTARGAETGAAVTAAGTAPQAQGPPVC